MILVADDSGNEAEFASVQAAVAGINAWFSDVLEASCQGLSDAGIEAMFPGLQARLRAAVSSVPVPSEPEALVDYAQAVAERVLGACATDAEREAVGVPARLSVRRS